MITATLVTLFLVLAPQDPSTNKPVGPVAGTEKPASSPKVDSSDKAQPPAKVEDAPKQNPVDALLPVGSSWTGHWTTHGAQDGNCRSIRVVERTETRAVLLIEAENTSLWTFTLEIKRGRWFVADVRHERGANGGHKKIDSVLPGDVRIKGNELFIRFEFQLANKTTKGTITAVKL